jgi:hypothetical protein
MVVWVRWQVHTQHAHDTEVVAQLTACIHEWTLHGPRFAVLLADLKRTHAGSSTRSDPQVGAGALRVIEECGVGEE